MTPQQAEELLVFLRESAYGLVWRAMWAAIFVSAFWRIPRSAWPYIGMAAVGLVVLGLGGALIYSIGRAVVSLRQRW